jgi:hypothetical protein
MFALQCRPDEEWMCKACVIRDGLRDVEKVLSIRSAGNRPASAGKHEDEAGHEILVKRLDHAYLHSTWVPERDILLAADAFQGLKAKYRKFKQRVAELGGVDAVQEEEEANGLENGINTLWITPERIIAREEDENGMPLLSHDGVTKLVRG